MDNKGEKEPKQHGWTGNSTGHFCSCTQLGTGSVRKKAKCNQGYGTARYTTLRGLVFDLHQRASTEREVLLEIGHLAAEWTCRYEKKAGDCGLTLGSNNETLHAGSSNENQETREAQKFLGVENKW